MTRCTLGSEPYRRCNLLDELEAQTCYRSHPDGAVRRVVRTNQILVAVTSLMIVVVPLALVEPSLLLGDYAACCASAILP